MIWMRKEWGTFTVIMEIEKLPFHEAVEWLAAYYNITLEYDQQSQAEAQETKDKRKEMLNIIKCAHQRYMQALHDLPAEASAIQYLHNRGYSKERIKA